MVLLSEELKKIINEKTKFKLIPEQSKELDNKDALYKELSELTQTTEFELPPLSKANDDVVNIPFGSTFDKFRTSSGKVRLLQIDQNYIENLLRPEAENGDNPEEGKKDKELIELKDSISKVANFGVEDINNLKDKHTAKLKSFGIILRDRDTDYVDKSLSEVKTQDKYPFLLSTGTVYEHYSFGLTEHSKLISEMIPEPYVEVNQKLIDKLNLRAGEDIRIKTPAGHFIAVISVYGDYKVKPARNDVPEHIIFAPYNIEYYTDISKTNKTGVFNQLIPLFDPITGVPDFKTPCRIEYL